MISATTISQEKEKAMKQLAGFFSIQNDISNESKILSHSFNLPNAIKLNKLSQAGATVFAEVEKLIEEVNQEMIKLVHVHSSTKAEACSVHLEAFGEILAFINANESFLAIFDLESIATKGLMEKIVSSEFEHMASLTFSELNFLDLNNNVIAFLNTLLKILNETLMLSKNISQNNLVGYLTHPAYIHNCLSTTYFSTFSVIHTLNSNVFVLEEEIRAMTKESKNSWRSSMTREIKESLQAHAEKIDVSTSSLEDFYENSSERLKYLLKMAIKMCSGTEIFCSLLSMNFTATIQMKTLENFIVCRSLQSYFLKLYRLKLLIDEGFLNPDITEDIQIFLQSNISFVELMCQLSSNISTLASNLSEDDISSNSVSSEQEKE